MIKKQNSFVNYMFKVKVPLIVLSQMHLTMTTIFTGFGMTQMGIEPTTYQSHGGHSELVDHNLFEILVDL